jgi:hypothetical protein
VAEVLKRGVRIHPTSVLVRLGWSYGGYVIPEQLPRADWLCYSAWVGEDVSF